MAARPQGVRSFVDNLKADIAVKAAPGKLYSVNLSWSALAVGDRIVIHDSLSATGNKLFEFLIPTVVGSFAAAFPSVGKEANTGIFLNPNVLASGVLVVDIGFD